MQRSADNMVTVRHSTEAQPVATQRTQSQRSPVRGNRPHSVETCCSGCNAAQTTWSQRVPQTATQPVATQRNLLQRCAVRCNRPHSVENCCSDCNAHPMATCCEDCNAIRGVVLAQHRGAPNPGADDNGRRACRSGRVTPPAMRRPGAVVATAGFWFQRAHVVQPTWHGRRCLPRDMPRGTGGGLG